MSLQAEGWENNLFDSPEPHLRGIKDSPSLTLRPVFQGPQEGTFLPRVFRIPLPAWAGEKQPERCRACPHAQDRWDLEATSLA